MPSKKGKKRSEVVGTYVDDKGYLRISAGPCRGVRVHTLVAMAKLGRPLKPDEVVHHRDEDKQNPHPDNLQILSKNQHNAVSAKQYWFLKKLKKKEEEEWAEWFKDDVAMMQAIRGGSEIRI
jgi:hypothetical protein